MTEFTGAPHRTMRIVLLCSAFNGLTQRAWAELRERGHEVVVLRAPEVDVAAAVAAARPDLVVCPFLRERVPAEVHRRYPTVVVHPGPEGDRGPSSLDRAIMDGEPVWGVTAVTAVEEFDAGPVWASRTFGVPAIPTKSALYNGPVADAAVEVVLEVVARAADPAFVPAPPPAGRNRPPVRQAERRFDWSDPTEHVLRRVRAADGAPGVRVELCGLPVSVFDAHPATVPRPLPGRPGDVLAHAEGAVLVRTGDGGLWVGHLRDRSGAPATGTKLPAVAVLAGRLAGVPETPPDECRREIRYTRRGAVGTLRWRFHNGAMSTGQCRRLRTALRHALEQDTRVLVLLGGEVFSHGIHLGVIDAAPDPAAEAWANIVAIDDVCREVLLGSRQLVVSALRGNAGAGGVMLALAADRVLCREAVVLNPHYRSMGLFGSEYWTYVLPRRVGARVARELTGSCLPVGARAARRIGLVDDVVAGDPAAFEAAAAGYAARLADDPRYPRLLARKRSRRARDERHRPLHAYRRDELARMRADLFDDRHGFAQARRAFLTGAPVRSPEDSTSRTRRVVTTPGPPGVTHRNGGTMNVYTRIGGAAAVRAAVELFYEKVLADDRLAGYFDLDRMDALREHQRAFLATALGGPAVYRGRSMSEAHAGLDVAPEHFDAVVGHLVATLTELEVPPDVIDEIGARLLPLKAQIAPARVPS